MESGARSVRNTPGHKSGQGQGSKVGQRAWHPPAGSCGPQRYKNGPATAPCWSELQPSQQLQQGFATAHLACGAPGLYIYGSVGSGKSLIMQMFYDKVAEARLVPLRRWMHFNAAMLEVQLPVCPKVS